MMMEALSSSETSVLTRATQRNIREDGILHSHLRENLKSYVMNNYLLTTAISPLFLSVVVYDLGASLKLLYICAVLLYICTVVLGNIFWLLFTSQ
jgi:hypothetical protein